MNLTFAATTPAGAQLGRKVLLAVLVLALLLPGRASADEPHWFKIVNRNSGRVLDVTSASTRDGANVQQWAYAGAGSPQQLWKLIPVADGFVVVENQRSGKVLDVLAANKNNGANVQQWNYAGPNAHNQHWKFVSVGDGYFRIVNQHSAKVLDVVSAGSQDGANVQQWDYAGATSPQQHWKLEEVSVAAVPPPAAARPPAAPRPAMAAQPSAEVTAVGKALQAYFQATVITVSNVRFEGALAAAEIESKDVEGGQAFLKKSAGTWQVLTVGSAFGPGTCVDLGFSARSKICPY